MNDDKGGFVSRGGVKLQAAIENFKLKIENLTCLDVGSSTGGFVDCLLQGGAAKVYSVDTSYGELAWKLRNDPRVVVMERTNILHMTSHPELASGSIDLITIDAGWTKLELVLPVVKKYLKPEGKIVALLKPHYEAQKSQLQKGVLLPEYLDEVVESVKKKIENCKLKIENFMESPIKGGAGNIEYLLLLKLEEV